MFLMFLFKTHRSQVWDSGASVFLMFLMVLKTQAFRGINVFNGLKSIKNIKNIKNTSLQNRGIWDCF